MGSLNDEPLLNDPVNFRSWLQEFFSVAAFLSLFWGLLFSLNFFIKRSNLRNKYERFLATFGITVALGHVKIFTTNLNRFFARCSKCCPRWQRKWFCVGAIFGLVAMVSSVVILILSLWNTFTIERYKKQQQPHQKLTMVVPGLNLPSSQVSSWLNCRFRGCIVYIFKSENVNFSVMNKRIGVFVDELLDGGLGGAQAR